MCAYMEYTELQTPTVAHCLLNQVRLDPLTIIVSLTGDPCLCFASVRHISLVIRNSRQTRRSLMAYFSLAKASKITFQHNLPDTSASPGAATSYTRINRNLTSAPEKKGNGEYAVFSYQFVSSFFGGFPINSKHEVWRFYCRFASSAHKSCEFPPRWRDVRKIRRGDAGAGIEPRCFDSPFWNSVRDTQIRSLCAGVARYYDNPDAYSRRNDGHAG